MKKEDRIKTTIGLDGSEFEKIMIKLDDGRILPCIREELEVITS